MKRAALFAVCAIAATAAAAQWHYLSGGKLSGISSVGSYVWAVGQDGLFFYSVDNGQSWRRVPRFTTRNLVDVEFWDQSFGLITAEGDIVYRTTDNGGTWDSSYVQYIGGHIRFITRDCIWVTSNGGSRILRSTDAGLSWPLSRGSVNSSWFLDSLNGWGGTSIFGRTTDAGQHWRPLSSLPGDCVCLGFEDSLHGVVAWYYWYDTPRGHYEVSGWSVTTDGGVSWGDLVSGSPGVVCDVDAHGRVSGAEQHGIIVYRPSGHSRTDASTFQEFRDVSAARGDKEWVCGDGAAIWSSADSGGSWTAARPQSGARFYNVDFCDSLHGWGTLSDWAARTTDAGRSWTRAATYSGISGISDVIAVGESTCLTAAGWSVPDFMYYDGEFALERTADAGASWDNIRYVNIYLGASIGSSPFSRIGRHIWHPGTRFPNGNSLRSTDGGVDWLDMDSIGTIGDNEPYDICFVDTLHGWVIDSRQNVRVTNTSGDSWTIIATGLDVKRLKMTSLMTGWAISDSELFGTTDGGMSWQSVMTQPGLKAIAFCDSMHGTIVGKKGLILRTSDGGETWVWDENDFTSDLYDVFMLDSTHGWAVGQYGLVLGFGDWAIGVDEARGDEGPYPLTAAVVVRPNPCRGRATVELSRPLVRPARVTLVDIAGRVQQVIPAPSGVRSVELDLRSTASGVYFVRAGSGPTARLVVQR